MSGWSKEHRAMGYVNIKPHVAVVELINAQTVRVWLQIHAEQASDAIVAEHLLKSLGELERALARRALCKAKTDGDGDGDPGAQPEE